jgi:hypothetical protein
MKTSDGYDQCYNGQIAVDEASQLLWATHLRASSPFCRAGSVV